MKSVISLYLSQISDNSDYLFSGPPFFILLHPALGPLWDVTKQKVTTECLVFLINFSIKNIKYSSVPWRIHCEGLRITNRGSRILLATRGGKFFPINFQNLHVYPESCLLLISSLMGVSLFSPKTWWAPCKQMKKANQSYDTEIGTGQDIFTI